jgi:hypothetical protein
MTTPLFDPRPAIAVLEQALREYTDRVRGKLAYLGNPASLSINDDGLLATLSGTDSAVYVHSQRDNPRSVSIAVLSPGYPPECVAYGAPVHVQNYEGRLVVTAPYGSEAAIFFAQKALNTQISVLLKDINLLLLVSNLTWTCTVSPAILETGGTRFYFQSAIADDDFETEAAGVTAGKAKVCLVEVDAANGTLYYSYSAEFDYDPSLQLPSHEEAFNSDYPVTTTDGREPAGYIRLYPTQTRIEANDVFPAQRVVGGGGSSGGVDILVYVGL